MSDENNVELENVDVPNTAEVVDEGPTELEQAMVIVSKVNDGSGCDGDAQDEMIIELIGLGFGFKKAGRLMVQALEALELKLSSKERKEQAAELIEALDGFPDDWDGVQKLGEYLADNITDTTPKQGITLIKGWAKVNTVEMPVRPKGTGGGGGAFGTSGFRGASYAFLRDNPGATDDEIVAFCEAADKPKLAQGTINLLAVCREIAKSAIEKGVEL